MDDFEAFLTGYASGLTVASSGAVKDAPYEGYKSLTFLRSPFIGAFEAPIINRVFRKNVQGGLLFLSTIATERLTVEVYKLLKSKFGSYKPGKFINGEWGVPVG